ncbi:MAG: chemotaxis protein CheW [Oscillospiraceae bacterium]
MSNILNRFKQQEEIVVTTEKFLSFLIGERHYAFPISEVQEIVEVQEITDVPEFPYYVKGVINLRGVIIPVISVRMRFNKPEIEFDDRTCIIVLRTEGVEAGFIVDTVEEVIDLDKKDISPVPDIMTGTHTRFIDNVGKIGKKIVMLLSAKRMLTSDEIKSFDVNAAVTKQSKLDNTDKVLTQLESDLSDD